MSTYDEEIKRLRELKQEKKKKLEMEKLKEEVDPTPLQKIGKFLKKL